VGTVVGELLVAAADSPASPRKEVIAATITKHVQSAMGGNFSAFARKLRVHRRTAWEWGQGTQVPQLDALLQICAYLGTSPRDLLRGKALEGEQCNVANKPLVEKSTRGVRKFETEKIQLVLEAVLQGDEVPPPSMRKMAQHLNYDQSHLRKHFPDLCRAISARHRVYQQEQRLSRIRRTIDDVQQAAQTLHEHGRALSERQVGKLLGKRGVFKEDEVRVVLKNRCR
jgi:hypothetical protein